ncbi:MAG: BON domain-containing protein [Burkholderiaceae bacterium]|nr:BON domain-containing protein [Burkholderiaceae bacterium]
MNVRRCALRALAAAAAASAIAGCAPLVVGGAMVGGAIVASDRRSVGIQLEDEAIERRINRALAERFERGTININVTSYNRKVLLPGEVLTAEAKGEAERIAANTENVRAVLNELGVGRLSTVGSRAKDTAISGKVRAAFLESKRVPAGAVKVTTERAIVYLLGRVTPAEGDAAAQVAARVSDVLGVVKAFDYITEKELEELLGTPAAPESQRK